MDFEGLMVLNDFFPSFLRRIHLGNNNDNGNDIYNDDHINKMEWDFFFLPVFAFVFHWVKKKSKNCNFRNRRLFIYAMSVVCWNPASISIWIKWVYQPNYSVIYDALWQLLSQNNYGCVLKCVLAVTPISFPNGADEIVWTTLSSFGMISSLRLVSFQPELLRDWQS